MKYNAKQTEAFFLSRYEELGMTQTEIAKKSGITESDMSRYKNQKGRPRLEQLERLAEALEVDVLTLMIGLGALDPKGPAMPKVVKEGKNTKVIWNL